VCIFLAIKFMVPNCILFAGIKTEPRPHSFVNFSYEGWLPCDEGGGAKVMFDEIERRVYQLQ
jgi:hypothetical protein